MAECKRPAHHFDAKRAFTLVELLIVVIIIGILAAVAIPQFGDSATDAKKAALDADLTSMRSSIELYFHQHGSTYPGAIQKHKAGAADPAAHASVEDAFVKQLTCYSDATGNTADTRDTTNYPYGPYVRRGIPKNPLPTTGAAAAADAVVVGADTGPLAADANPTKGWKFSSVTGQFIANNADYDDR
ncbi:MAG TPA: prepilin-type N-terminal cleavage/methylation domain-containing protein [Planctomycetota bacterium]|nr:prepilin-type N-terminal cleavage/methylation domain-containing protein [Planctomycetota bacterium]